MNTPPACHKLLPYNHTSDLFKLVYIKKIKKNGKNKLKKCIFHAFIELVKIIFPYGGFTYRKGTFPLNGDALNTSHHTHPILHILRPI